MESMPSEAQRCPTSGITNMAIVISSQKMYSLADDFEARPVESLMKKRRDITSSISCWFWSLERKRLGQNWRRSRLDVDISIVATTSSLNCSLRLVVTTFTQAEIPERPTSSESSVMESSMESTPHLRFHHYPAPPGTSWWKTNRITLHRRKLLALSRHSPARGSIVLTGDMEYVSHMIMVHPRDASVANHR